MRPHDISFGPIGLPGRVLSSRFGGNAWHTRVQVGGAEWLVETRPGTTVPAEGSTVALAWPPGRTLVLRD